MGCSVVHYLLAAAICSDNSKKRRGAAEGDPRLAHSHLMPDNSKKRGALGWCGLRSPAVHALNGTAGGPRSPGVTPRPEGFPVGGGGRSAGSRPPFLRGLGPEGALAG